MNVVDLRVTTDARIEALRAAGEIDVVIIGAGVNGAGLFRDLCEQGVDCLIVDKGDFGSGASAAPSRLIHGGLKYLETGEFRLVAQSTLERNLLLKNAPHLVKPLPTLIPLFSWTNGVVAALRTLAGSKTASRGRGALLIKIGLMIYDYFGARQRVMPRHTMISRARALQQMPALTKAIKAVGVYYDARITAPERLVYELIADGLATNPRAVALNYTRLQALEDDILDFALPDGERLRIRPRVAANAAGPWIDAVNASMGARTKWIGGTKGSHILLRHDDLVRALGGRMLYFEANDGRICLVYEYLGLALVGASDIPADNPDDVKCEDDEVNYFLESLSTLLPGFVFDRAQIVFTYSGIRPLPASDVTNPGLISRDHSTPTLEPDGARTFPVIALVGGKWTTFRGFAEEVADGVLTRLGKVRKLSTQTLPIGGGRSFPHDAAARDLWLTETAAATGVACDRLNDLLDRYGATAQPIAHHISAFPNERPLAHAKTYSHAEIDYLSRYEQVARLSDIVLRRTTLAITGALGRGDVDEIAGIVGAALGWNEARRSAEIEATVQELTNRYCYCW